MRARGIVRIISPVLALVGFALYAVAKYHPEYLIATGVAGVVVGVAVILYWRYHTRKLERMLAATRDDEPGGSRPPSDRLG